MAATTTALKPIHDELKTLKNGWGKKRENLSKPTKSDLIIWNAANRFLHANLPEGTKSLQGVRVAERI